MKTTYKYDHYFTYEEIKKNIETFKKMNSSIFSYEVICETLEKRNVYAVTITNKKTGDALSKPAFYIDGNTHAGEVTGSMAAMHTMDYLVTNYPTNKEVKKLVDENTFYIIPRVSPDGAETYLTTPYSLRSVNRPYKEEKGGLYQEDIDNDGVIRMMRVKDPYGPWKKDPKNPDVMIKRLPDDTEGTYYSVYTEGNIEDFDGVHVNAKKPVWGLDFNRNYPFGWFSEYRQPGAGEYPLSNAENKAIVDFVIAHPNIGAVATHHTSGGVILYPPGTKPEKDAFPFDIQVYKTIGAMGKEEMGYDPIDIFDTFTDDQENYASGAFDDWCYQTHGIYAYTIELWDLANRAGVPYIWGQRKAATIEEQTNRFAACLKWVIKNAPTEFKKWKKFKHPSLGDVEIGGFNYKFTHQNPPCKFLNQEVEKTTKFCLRYAHTLPSLVIDKVSVELVATGVYEITAVVSNKGYLPTYLSDEAKMLKVDKPVKVCIDVKDTAVVNGKAEQVIGDLSSFAKVNTGVFFYGNISTGTSDPITKKVTWIVKGKKGQKIVVKATSQKAGIAQTTVTL